MTNDGIPNRRPQGVFNARITAFTRLHYTQVIVTSTLICKPIFVYITVLVKGPLQCTYILCACMRGCVYMYMYLNSYTSFLLLIELILSCPLLHIVPYLHNNHPTWLVSCIFQISLGSSRIINFTKTYCA